MIKMRFAGPLLGFLFGVAVPSLVRADSAQVLAYLDRLKTSLECPGVSAAVAVNGQIVFSDGVGLADLEAGAPLTGSTVHCIGSISKTQSLVAVMQLVEQGKVDLDAEIQTYLPWFPRKDKPVTVREILTHTSGIRHYHEIQDFTADRSLAFRHFQTLEEATRFWRDDPLLFEPGTYWRYSSFATSLMQGIVEKASGEQFGDYLHRHVWVPAGMFATRLEVAHQIIHNRGRGYTRNPTTGLLESYPDEDVSYKYASGGVLSTDEDLCRFGIALNQGRLLKPATLAEMYRVQLTADIKPFDDPAVRRVNLSAQADEALAAIRSITAEEPPESSAARRAHVALGALQLLAANLPGGSHPSASNPIDSRPAEWQALIWRMEYDQAGRLYAGHSGSVNGTLSMLENFKDQGVVVAVHINQDISGLRMEDIAADLAQLFLLPIARK